MSVTEPEKTAEPSPESPPKKKLKLPSLPFIGRKKDESLSELVGIDASQGRPSSKRFRDLLASLVSTDWPTRRMAILFFLSSFGILVVAGLGVKQYIDYRLHRTRELSQSELDQKHLSEFLKKQAQDAKDRVSSVELGTFTFQIKPLPNESQHFGVMDLGEVDIVLKCKGRETREYIEAHGIQAKNQVTAVLVPLDRSEWMTPEGKARIKKQMLQRLNTWLKEIQPEYKVEKIYFARFVLS